MKKVDFIEQVINQGAEVLFEYNGRQCGIHTSVEKSVFSFQTWYGNDIKEYGAVSVEVLMDDPFFGGKTISQLMEEIDFYYC